MTCSIRSGRITVSRSMPSWCWVRDQHRLQRHRHAVFVLERHLRLAVGAQVRHLAGLAHGGEALGQAVGGPDRQRHQVGRLVAGVAEHHPLVAGALGVERVLAGLRRRGSPRTWSTPWAMFGRLLVDRDDHAARAAVEAVQGVVVADRLDRLAGELRDVDVGRGGDLTGDDAQPGGEQRLAGHPAVGILGEDRVEHRVADLVGHLVGVAFGHALGGKGPTGHRHPSSLGAGVLGGGGRSGVDGRRRASSSPSDRGILGGLRVLGLGPHDLVGGDLLEADAERLARHRGHLRRAPCGRARHRGG